MPWDDGAGGEFSLREVGELLDVGPEFFTQS